jgi:hypothetical protein
MVGLVSQPSGGVTGTRRRLAAVGLAVAMALVLHLWLLDRVQATLQALDLDPPAMQRIEASFTRTVTPAAPPPVTAAAPPPPRTQPKAVPATPVAEAASASEASASAPDPALAQAADVAASEPAPEPAPEPAAPALASAQPVVMPDAASAAVLAPATPPTAAVTTAVAAAAPATPPAPAASAAGTPFRWPASTRLRYQLAGWYNGEVLGNAQVEWLRQGERYQVHLDVAIGPSFAPLARRRMSSEGRIGPAGLVPERYEQETTQIIGRNRRAQMRFDEAGVLLARGERVPTHPDLQDTASQFIQIIYLLTTQPALRQPGQALEFGLALPNRVDRWVYEVVGLEAVDTPFGLTPALHVKPRRRAEAGNLTAQMWYAPTLQMLPVRIRIEQDANVWVDLRLDHAPEQAGP